jgi:hypothetical protein
LRASRTACLFSFPHENKGQNMTIGCASARISGAILKKRFIEPARLPAYFDQMISIAGRQFDFRAYLGTKVSKGYSCPPFRRWFCRS